MTPGSAADRVLLAHMGECIARVGEHTGGARSRYESSRRVQDAVLRKLQSLAESLHEPDLSAA